MGSRSVRVGCAAAARQLSNGRPNNLGFLCIFATIELVAGSAGLSGSGLDIFEIGIFLMGIAAAVVFFWVGTRGTAHELLVDTFRRQFRSAVRGYRGTDRIEETHDFANVESAFVRRRSQRARNGEFSLRTRSEENGVTMLSGNAEALSNLHVILSRMISTPLRASRATNSLSALGQTASVAAQ